MNELLSKNTKEIDWSLWLLSFMGGLIASAIIFGIIITTFLYYGKLIVH